MMIAPCSQVSVETEEDHRYQSVLKTIEPSKKVKHYYYARTIRGTGGHLWGALPQQIAQEGGTSLF